MIDVKLEQIKCNNDILLSTEKKLPDGWVVKKLGEVVDLAQGLAINVKTKYLLADVGIPLLRITDLINNKFSQFVKPDSAPLQCVVQLGDVIFTRTGQVGLVFNNKYGVLHNNSFKVIPKNNQLDKNYLYWFLSQKSIYDLSNSVASGSVQKDLNHGAFKIIEINLPPLPEQKQIANVLSSLDDKIECNQQINKKLEEMAQAIFKQWFIDFNFPNEQGNPYKDSGGVMVESEFGLIPEGWNVGKLESVVDFYNGHAFKSNDFISNVEYEEFYHVFKMGHIKKGGGFNKQGTKSYILKLNCYKLEKFILRAGDLCMAMTDMKGNVAILGHTALVDQDNKYIVNQRVGLLRIKNKKVINFPYLSLLSNEHGFIENIRSKANSGVQVNLSSEVIKSQMLIIPASAIHYLFNEIFEPVYYKIFNNQKETEYLSSLRDMLLPKLMSGEVRV